jgi:asparagine synthase (glutamine-hydrolysing)
MDQPSIDGFNTYCVAGLARSHGMKVVLSGLGGDEVFGGYPSFAQVPALLRKARLAAMVPGLGWAMQTWAPRLPLRRAGSLVQSGATLTRAYRAYRGIFPSKDAKTLAARLCGCKESDIREPADPALPEGNVKDQVSAAELQGYMRNQLLKDSDVMSMAHGLELRVPLVDRQLFDTLSHLPAEVRLQRGKQCLLNAVPEVPAWVANQPKRGFLFPYEKWLAADWGSRINKARELIRDRQPTWYQRWSVFMLTEWLERR